MQGTQRTRGGETSGNPAAAAAFPPLRLSLHRPRSRRQRGRSDRRAIANAVFQAVTHAHAQVTEQITAGLSSTEIKGLPTTVDR